MRTSDLGSSARSLVLADGVLLSAPIGNNNVSASDFDWQVIGTLYAHAMATRFPTVGELYQATTVATVLASPNPSLRPERARTGKVAVHAIRAAITPRSTTVTCLPTHTSVSTSSSWWICSPLSS